MVALALEERGIDVVSVGNGEAAVRRIPDLAPDLVLADVFMPVRNGYEVCEFVKTNQRFAHVPVILLVGAFDPLDEKEARRVGADGVLKKPFVPPDPLIAMVTSALEKNPKAVAPEASQARPVTPAAHPETRSYQSEAPAKPAPQPPREYAKQTPEADDEMPVYGFEKATEKSEETSFTPRFSSREMQQGADDDFDSTATASDWRRNAANFEVPDDLNGKMAVTPNETFHAAVFPSEQDVPPKRVPVAHDEQRDQQDEVASASKVEQSSETGLSGFDSTPVQQVGFTAHLQPAAEPEPTASEEHSLPQPHGESQTTPSSAADALPSPSEYAEDGWMSSLLGKFRRDKSEHEADEPKDEPGSSKETVSSEGSAAIETKGVHQGEQAEPAAVHAEEKSEQFFAPEAPAAESWFAPHPPMVESPEQHDEPASPFSPEPAYNLLAAPADANNSERTIAPEKYEPAVVSHESDIEHDQRRPAIPADEFAAADTNAGAASFFSTSRVEDVDHNSTDHPPTQFNAAAPGFTSAEAEAEAIETPTEDAAEPGQAEAETSERIPTGPPPNREALAEIPFLTPPPPAPFAPPVSNEPKATPSAAETPSAPSVDAVVNRLLEKLKPQLHDMLAKDLLKPLVESLLNEELPEKSK